jgi:hypothetical protein
MASGHTHRDRDADVVVPNVRQCTRTQSGDQLDE